MFDAFKSSGPSDTESRDLRTTVKAIRDAVKLRTGLTPQERPEVSTTQDDNDNDDVEGSFTTDATFSLLSQFVSALAVAVNEGWEIFDDGYELVFDCDKCAQFRPPEICLMNHWR